MPNPTVQMIHTLQQVIATLSTGNDQEALTASATMSRMPQIAPLYWHGRICGDPWPDGAPWSADTPWAKMALEFERGPALMPLDQACDLVMADWLGRGDPRAFAEWVAAGWAPGIFALRTLAGYLHKDHAAILLDKDGKPNAEGKRIDVSPRKGRKQDINNVLRDLHLSRAVEQKMASGSKYEFAISDVAKAHNKDAETVRNAYDKRHRGKNRRN